MPGYIFKLKKNGKQIAKVISVGILLSLSDKYGKFIEPIGTDSKLVYWFKVNSQLLESDTDSVLLSLTYHPVILKMYHILIYKDKIRKICSSCLDTSCVSFLHSCGVSVFI